MKKQDIASVTVVAILIAVSALGMSRINPAPAHAQTPVTQGSSIKTPAETGGTEVNDAVEAQQLQGMAKITSDQAKAAAEKNVGGTASSVKLEEENGNVVYSVVVGQKEVKVDAGNGTVLRSEAADTGESETERAK